jgi:hypothetical protein
MAKTTQSMISKYERGVFNAPSFVRLRIELGLDMVGLIDWEEDRYGKE